MSISYSLKVTQMDCVAPDDTVVVVHWAYTGTDGTASTGFGGSTTITRDHNQPLTPYSQLTPEQVEGWVLGAWTPEEKANYESIIASQIQKVSPELPWAKPTEGSAA